MCALIGLYACLKRRALALACMTMVASAESVRLETTDGNGWRFGNEAMSVVLSGKTGWPLAWDVGGRNVLSYSNDPNDPWEISYLASDGKGPLLHTGKVKVKSVEKRGDGVVCISESDGWLVALHLSFDDSKRRS